MMLRFQTLIGRCGFGLLLVFLMTLGREVVAQDARVTPRIEVIADRDSVQILDPFEVELKVTASENASVQFPVVAERLGPFEVLDHRDILGVPVEGEPGTRQWTRRLTLETIETGLLDVPAIEVFLREAAPIRLATKPLSIKVSTVLEAASDPAKFNDIRDVIDVAEPQGSNGSTFYWIGLVAAGGLALSAIAGAVFVFVRRQQWTTPAGWANGEIENLAPESSSALGELERILRTFVETEFGFPATALTAEQLRQNLTSAGACVDCVSEIETFLSKANECKFAGLNVSTEAVTDAKSAVRTIIEQLDAIPAEVN